MGYWSFERTGYNKKTQGKGTAVGVGFEVGSKNIE